MRRILTFLYATALVLVGCNRIDTPSAAPVMPEAAGEGVIDFATSIAGETATKAADVNVQGKEGTVTAVDIFCFDADGSIVRHVANGTSKTGSISVPAGTYTLYAVVNGPAAAASATSLSALESIATTLGGDNGTSSDFIMTGYKSVTVTAGETTPATIDVTRIAGRVKLVSVKNNCNASLGSLTIKAVFLSNVYNRQNLAGNASQSLGDGNANWSNPYGRPRANLTAGGKLTAASSADDADLTFRAMNTSIATGATDTSVSSYFYAYPNSQTGNAAFSTTYAMSYTRLVVLANLGGVDYYYPVVLTGGIARNASSDVMITISGEGADDPQGEVRRGTVDVTVNTKPWDQGYEYSENL